MRAWLVQKPCSQASCSQVGTARTAWVAWAPSVLHVRLLPGVWLWVWNGTCVLRLPEGRWVLNCVGNPGRARLRVREFGVIFAFF